jgi:hypothetical protein
MGSVFEIVLILFIGVAGFLPDLFGDKWKKYRLPLIGIFIAALLINIFIQNKKETQLINKETREKQFNLESKDLRINISKKLGQYISDYSFRESANEIIEKSKSIIGMLDKEDANYLEELKEEQDLIENYENQLKIVNDRINSDENMNEIKVYLSNYFTEDRDSTKMKIDKMLLDLEKLLKIEGYKKSYMEANNISGKIIETLESSFKETYNESFINN